MKKVITVLFLSAATFSCANYSSKIDVKKDYDNWREAKTSQKATVEKEWWKNFQDEKLLKIIETARANNNDIQIALARIDQARANEASILGQNLPVVNAKATAGKRRTSQNVTNTNFSRKYSDTYIAEFDSSWELNLFRIEPAIRAGAENTEKNRELYNDALVTVTGEVASSYFELRKTQMQQSLQAQKLEVLEEKLQLQQSLQTAGKIDGVQLSQTETERALALSQLEVLSNQFKQQKYQLEFLSGVKPGEFDELINASYTYIVPERQLVANAPAAVLSNRPDVRAAERNLYYSGAVKDVAVTSLLPSITLTGLLGFESGRTGNLFSTESMAWNATGGLLTPIIDYKKIRADIMDANAKVKEAVASYNKAVLGALTDVESSFAAYDSSFVNLSAVRISYATALNNQNYKNDRYEKGFDSYSDFVDAKVARLEAEKSLEEAKAENLIQLVRVYKALGGGW